MKYLVIEKELAKNLDLENGDTVEVSAKYEYFQSADGTCIPTNFVKPKKYKVKIKGE